MEYTPNNIINIALVGHSGSGKTVLCDSLLFNSKVIRSIGQIDKDALLYLQARGINKKKALAMLIRAFTDEVVEPIDSEKILDVFHNVVNDWFSRSKIMN